jgi:hypothetical protein
MKCEESRGADLVCEGVGGCQEDGHLAGLLQSWQLVAYHLGSNQGLAGACRSCKGQCIQKVRSVDALCLGYACVCGPLCSS